MTPRPRLRTPPPPPTGGRIVDIDVDQEMSASFLEYAYSVIYSRALPDARDGLKPVQRRILYQMAEMGLNPDRGHVKCARVVGDVMGKLHPHGDTAIYDTLVRMAQPWVMRLPTVDGHGNFGSLDDGPAAYRYTECRLAPAARPMTDSLDEDVVDFTASYDGAYREPVVLPAAFPHLLVNGASGIAVGMATNMIPHNLGEVIAAARHLLVDPDADLDTLMGFVPGPDLPTGGAIVGTEGIRETYQTGRGTVRIRATTSIEPISARRQGIVVTELPYGVGVERVKEKIGELVRAHKLTGVADVEDHTDHEQGLRLVVEIKPGFVPEAVLDQLYRLTPMEETFGINNVALVDGQPRTLGLRELLTVYVEHRREVVRRRTTFRRTRAAERLHLVDGLLVAILDIDRVIATIRASDDTASARQSLMTTFELSDAQAGYILEMPLRRLTRFSHLELQAEHDELGATITALDAILVSDALLRQTVSDELAEVARVFANPRRTRLLDATVAATASTALLEIVDEPCLVALSATGLVARTPGTGTPTVGTRRARHDVITSLVRTTTRGSLGVLTSAGRVHRLGVLDLPVLDPASPSLSTGVELADLLPALPDEHPVGLVDLSSAAPLALGTAEGVVKRVVPEWPANKDEWEVIGLRAGDQVVGCGTATDDDELVMISSDGQLLRFPAAGVRPQGRSAGGMAGMRLGPGTRAVYAGVVSAADVGHTVVVTLAGGGGTLPGTGGRTVKVSGFSEFPAKGRATGGVRSHRFGRGEDELVLAWVGAGPARACTTTGVAVELPEPTARRDGPGVPSPRPVTHVGGTWA
ncbi:MAG: DNA gyrase/topoisomerase IV subunit A [Actinomycetes bacterium]